MGNSNNFVRWDAEILTLQAGSSDKLGRGDIGGRNTVFFKVGDIVRTARYARPSRADRFDDSVTP